MTLGVHNVEASVEHDTQWGEVRGLRLMRRGITREQSHIKPVAHLEYPVGGPRRSEASELALVVFSVSDSSSSSSTTLGSPTMGTEKPCCRPNFSLLGAKYVTLHEDTAAEQ